ncbi:hypothetical protein [Stutzerimonas nitrititolerans]|uniref:hypothetical protein n=1 Tax=Stutzerimonas nitrititolerans TaxID=2482751 RepID=UPI0028AF68FC|nr:hypothetical protein [Stutzerimonas nitrititolerans]
MKKKPAQPRHTRDDFSHKTIRMLRDMASGLCSKPDCGVFTSGSLKLRDNAASIGVAAHICAAAPGGKRYDESMNKGERSSPNNGLWLCQSCSRLIDTDEFRFPAELLHDWKVKAEQRSTKLVGQRFISQDQHDSGVRRSIGQAIAHHVAGYQHPLDTPILETINGYAHNLEELDPRFHVKVSTVNNALVHKLYAREDFSIQMHFQNTPEIAASLKSLHETGEPIELPSSSFSFSGSPLLESIVNRGEIAKLTIGGTYETYDARFAVSDGMSQRVNICNLKAQALRGNKSFSLSGVGLEGFFSFRYEISRDTYQSKLTYNFDTNQWQQKRLSELAHFARLLRIKEHLQNNPASSFLLTVLTDEDDINFAHSRDKQESFIVHFCFLINHIHNVRQLLLDHPSAIFETKEISHDTDALVQRYIELEQGSQITNYEANKPICRIPIIDIDETILRNLIDAKGPLRINEKAREVTLLGNKVLCPAISHVLTGYKVRIEETDSSRTAVVEATQETQCISQLDSTKWQLL